MKWQIKLSTACMAALIAIVITTALPSFAQTPTPPPSPVALPTTEPTAVPFEDDRRVLDGDQTITGGNFTLRSGETLRGDLTIFGGNANLEEGSRVEGDVSVFGGNADIAGTVTKDVSVIGGNVRLRASARVEGDVNRVGGTVNRDPGAMVGGRETTIDVPFVPGPGGVDIPKPAGEAQTRVVVRDRGPFERLFEGIFGMLATLLGAVLISLIAIAIVAIFPSNVAQATTTLINNWLMSGAVGALTIIAVPIIAVVLAVTICLIPIALLLLLAYVVAILAGWTVSARIVGERVMMAVNRRDWTVIGQTLAGAILLALLGAVPIIGGIVGFIAAALGLGALILTWAGTRSYPTSFAPAYEGPSVPPPASAPAVASEPPQWPVPPNEPTEPASPDEPRQS